MNITAVNGSFHGARQMALQFEWKKGKNRGCAATVMTVLAQSDTFLSGVEVATRAGLSHKATVDALFYLYTEGRIARTGRKFTARWGRLSLQPVDTMHTSLESFFRALAPSRLE